MNTNEGRDSNASDEDWLFWRMGSTVTVDGQEWMLVEVKDKWAFLANEDERLRKMRASTVRRLLRVVSVRARLTNDEEES